ncbi:Uncharacterized protein TCM_022480 [Theobroma cacao]|uniref:Uncharacterized protein n=1 Tax=Theobroma cacao TaxID=3641 RepID=A0A061ETK0_THECC|nr:Uncharacterized protein TCM_022480 [Theobroma cacao]
MFVEASRRLPRARWGVPGRDNLDWGKLRIAEGGIRSRKSVTVVRHFPPGCGRNVRGQPENDKEKVTVASKPLRKVSGVRYFSLGCGRNAAPVSDEEYRRIQQAWIEEQRKKKSQKEENQEEDLQEDSE